MKRSLALRENASRGEMLKKKLHELDRKAFASRTRELLDDDNCVNSLILQAHKAIYNATSAVSMGSVKTEV